MSWVMRQWVSYLCACARARASASSAASRMALREFDLFSESVSKTRRQLGNWNKWAQKKRPRGKSRLYFAIQPGSRKVVMSAKKKEEWWSKNFGKWKERSSALNTSASQIWLLRRVHSWWSGWSTRWSSWPCDRGLSHSNHCRSSWNTGNAETRHICTFQKWRSQGLL